MLSIMLNWIPTFFVIDKAPQKLWDYGEYESYLSFLSSIMLFSENQKIPKVFSFLQSLQCTYISISW
jgi:hypothetical protein